MKEMHYLNFLRPSSYRVTHHLSSVNDLPAVADAYDLIIVDRDGTLQEHRGTRRVPTFDPTLRSLSHKLELLSNEPLGCFLSALRLYAPLFPVSVVLRMRGHRTPCVLRSLNQTTRLWTPADESRWKSHPVKERHLRHLLSHAHPVKKPDPRAIRNIVAVNHAAKRVPVKPRVLVCGDRYLTDIAAGNLSGADTALVIPYAPEQDPLWLKMTRSILDRPLGRVMAHL